MKYALYLNNWNLYPEAERLLGEYIERETKGKYLPEHRKVLHNRKISTVLQQQINAYIEALMDTEFGQP